MRHHTALVLKIRKVRRKDDSHTLFTYNVVCVSRGWLSMGRMKVIERLLEASPDGTITTEQVTNAGLHRSILQKLVRSGELYRFGRGLYLSLIHI